MARAKQAKSTTATTNPAKQTRRRKAKYAKIATSPASQARCKNWQIQQLQNQLNQLKKTRHRKRGGGGKAKQHPKQPCPNQPLPQQPLPKQPLPEQPLPKQPLPQQPLPKQPLPKQPLPKQPLPKQPLPQQQLPKRRHPKQPLPQKPRINYEALFQKVVTLNKVHGSTQRSKSKEPCVPYQGVLCNLCGITFFNVQSLTDHRKDASHKELFYMSQAREAAVNELLNTHAHLMIARDNIKQEQGNKLKLITRCQVCATLHRMGAVDHNKTKYHLVLNDYQTRECQQCKLPLRGIETIHRDTPNHVWEELEDNMCNKVNHFDGLFNLDKNLQISALKGHAIIKEMCALRDKEWDINQSDIISDYDPTKHSGINFINSRIRNYCFVCKVCLPVTRCRKILTSHPKDKFIHAEKHCCSYQHYVNLAKFLQDHQDELLEQEKQTSTEDEGMIATIEEGESPVEEDKEQTEHVNEEKTETPSMEVIESAASVTKEKKQKTETASVEEVIEPAASVPNENEEETQTTSMDVIEPATSVANENEEETQTASMEGIELAASVAEENKEKTETDSMEVIELAASVAEENEEETQTASMEVIEPADVAMANKPRQVMTEGSDDASSAAVPTEEISIGSTQHEEVEEHPRKVALIGDSWIQNFPVQSLPDKWNVSTYGWKEASAKAFLVREDVESVVETNPAVAVLHLGANDICKKYSSESIVCDIMDIVRTLEEENIITHVCEIPLKTAPLKISASDYDAVRQTVNRDLSEKLSSKSTNFIQIPDLKDNLINGINLSSEGYAKFSNILEKVIDSKCSVNATQ